MAPSKKQVEKQIADLKKQYTLSFTKHELIVMFNVLVSKEYRLGDAQVIFPAVRKIEALVAVDSNIAPESTDGVKVN